MTVPTQELNVKLRNEFLIKLPSNRTTGHRWQANYDTSFLQLSTTSYELASEKTGGGGTESFTFLPYEKGTTLIRMLYRRPWDKTIAKEALYTVTITD